MVGVRALEIAAILSLCTLSFVAFLPYEKISNVSWGRRYLQAGHAIEERPFPSTDDLDGQSASLVYPWAESNLVPHTVLPDPAKETYIFWHIPKVSVLNCRWEWALSMGMGVLIATSLHNSRVEARPNKSTNAWGLL